MKKKDKVALVHMPFGPLERPALGISLLKAALSAKKMECDIKYLNFPFAELTGVEEYCWLTHQLPYTAFAGDWCFTSALYGERPKADELYVDEVLRKAWQLSERDIKRVLRVRGLVRYFMDHCMAAVPWEEYAIVGFTSTFEQNIASLSLAKRLKESHPGLITVFGGANWEAEMGVELHRQFGFVDYVCQGESDLSFPALVRSVVYGNGEAEDRIPGVVYRNGGRSVCTGPAEPVHKLDELPFPNYDEYYAALEASGASVSIMPVLLFESSRGCWWGAKSSCMFCGLNGEKTMFRSKSPRRVVDEITGLTERYGAEIVEAVDNVLDMRYFKEVFPALASLDRPLQIFYEVRTNLNRGQIVALKNAGVRSIQPGIESLNDNVLRLMRKGTDALKNVYFLRVCKELGVDVFWNIIYGFPGETRDDYKAMLRLLRAVRFLGPPTGCGPLRLDRFSPYFRSPEKYGLTRPRPIESYRHIYPFGEKELFNIAYSFDYDYSAKSDPTGFASETAAYVEEWKRTPETGSLRSVDRPDGVLVLIDTRSNSRRREILLDGHEKAAYAGCYEVRRGGKVANDVTAEFPRVSTEEVFKVLDSFVDDDLMVTDGERYLSLAIPITGIG